MLIGVETKLTRKKHHRLCIHSWRCSNLVVLKKKSVVVLSSC